MEEITIGTRIRINNGNGTMTEKDYVIIDRKDYTEVKDWCDHFIVKSDDGQVREIQQYQALIPPKDCKHEEERIQNFLDDNGVWAEVYQVSGTTAIAVDISWGDWKHEHLWCRDLMNFLGYAEIGSKVTEENGSDCYSAIHYFLTTERHEQVERFKKFLGYE